MLMNKNVIVNKPCGTADAGKQGQIGMMNGLKYVVTITELFTCVGNWVWDNCRPHIYEYNAVINYNCL